MAKSSKERETALFEAEIIPERTLCGSKKHSDTTLHTNKTIQILFIVQVYEQFEKLMRFLW